jgi:hypothetical protein
MNFENNKHDREKCQRGKSEIKGMRTSFDKGIQGSMSEVQGEYNECTKEVQEESQLCAPLVLLSYSLYTPS